MTFLSLMETEAIANEARLQNLLRQGYKIIRPELNPYRIEQKNKGRRGWVKIEPFDTLKQMTTRLLELGSQEKTIIYNE